MYISLCDLNVLHAIFTVKYEYYKAVYGVISSRRHSDTPMMIIEYNHPKHLTGTFPGSTFLLR